MGIELKLLAWSMLLGVAHLLLTSAAVTHQRGLAWNASARDDDGPPLKPLPARLQRAQRNFMETFPFFAAAVLAVVIAGRQDSNTALAVQLYFWARVVYLPLYAAGIPYLRSLVWVVSLVGVMKLVWTLV